MDFSCQTRAGAPSARTGKICSAREMAPVKLTDIILFHQSCCQEVSFMPALFTSTPTCENVKFFLCKLKVSSRTSSSFVFLRPSCSFVSLATSSFVFPHRQHG
jgi:hypothetical protein